MATAEALCGYIDVSAASASASAIDTSAIICVAYVGWPSVRLIPRKETIRAVAIRVAGQAAVDEIINAATLRFGLPRHHKKH